MTRVAVRNAFFTIEAQKKDWGLLSTHIVRNFAAVLFSNGFQNILSECKINSFVLERKESYFRAFDSDKNYLKSQMFDVAFVWFRNGQASEFVHCAYGGE